MPTRAFALLVALVSTGACTSDVRDDGDAAPAELSAVRASSDSASRPDARDAEVVAGDTFPEFSDLPEAHRILLGAAHPPLPAGYKDLAGGLVPGNAGTEWSLSQLGFGDARFLTLDSMTHRVAGRAHWTIVAAIELPALQDSSEHIVEVDCSFDGKSDPTIVALGRWVVGGPHLNDLERIRLALRPHVGRRRFEQLPVDRVACWVDEDRG